ncbi:class I SAM-dependent methyltransferase [Oceanicoccus sp. KOV_DT_Chl]|uniref:class I SAM-dependent methyltransferase n=1 Tax=Oceanicoccus sp. KOV_DT_Chl TaxID=1904639 RepID=UPI00135CD01B|nr:class I SAM-dependent methyltransferase [Oceanicoccus sp. KOV_DT_Chl]
MYKYNEEFYNYIGGGAVDSAKIIVPLVLKVLLRQVDSVLDVGCGAGAWLSVWKEHGSRITGIDGEYVNRDMLMIAPDTFVGRDLRFEFLLPQHYDLVQCLEVAEHLPGSSAPQLVASLCRHSDIVVFSAAPPGQGGENHINEQDYSYWRDLFDKNNFQMYDCLRPI